MKHCPDCKQDKPTNQFYRKSEHCMSCNEKYCRNVMDLIRHTYKPEYPPHIQEYLDKRRERMLREAGYGE
jgi:hypothetical protein